MNDTNNKSCEERLSTEGRVIAIFGGSFNPVHLGHIALADAVCKTGVVDEVWFMVSPLNPLKKDNAEDILPAEQRIYITQLALKDYPHLKVSDVEIRLPVPSYTITTLTELKRLYPHYDFKLIIGQDNWKNFDRWVESQKIKDNHDIIVYGRKDETSSDQTQADNAEVIIHRKDGTQTVLSEKLQFKLYNISSTQIRQAFREHNLPFAAKWLTPPVFRYILENKLY